MAGGGIGDGNGGGKGIEMVEGGMEGGGYGDGKGVEIGGIRGGGIGGGIRDWNMCGNRLCHEWKEEEMGIETGGYLGKWGWMGY